MTFEQSITGPAFKVISETTGNIVSAFDALTEAQTYADNAHTVMPEHHFRVVEIRWCGGSKRLSDIDARKAAQ